MKTTIQCIAVMYVPAVFMSPFLIQPQVAPDQACVWTPLTFAALYPEDAADTVDSVSGSSTPRTRSPTLTVTEIVPSSCSPSPLRRALVTYSTQDRKRVHEERARAIAAAKVIRAARKAALRALRAALPKRRSLRLHPGPHFDGCNVFCAEQLVALGHVLVPWMNE